MEEPSEDSRRAAGVLGRADHDGVAAYAKKVGRPRTTVEREIAGAEVASKLTNIGQVADKIRHLAAIHAAAAEWVIRFLR